MGLFMHPPHHRTKTMNFVVMAMTLWTCTAVDPVELHGSGTTNPSKYFWKVMDLFEERAKIPLYMTYRAVGSSTGMAEFIGSDNPAGAYTAYNHFGSGDVPMKSSLFPDLATNGRSMVHIPFVMGAIAIFHSVPSADFGTKNEVDLDACTLAKIFSRTIKTWDDPAILAQNPGMKVPAGQNIKVVHRVKGSSSTAGTTEYLNTACPSEWKLGDPGTTVAWTDDTFEGQGSDGISEFIQANEYAIGYIDAGHGHRLGLSEVALQNKNGKYRKSDAVDTDIGAAGAVALADGILPADSSADWSAVNLYDLSGDTTWPITMFSYFYVEKDLSGMNADTAALLHAFISYTLSAEGQALLEDFRFSKVSAEVLTYNANTIAGITWPTGMEEFTFELKDETQKGAGAMDRVISGKRRSYADYERSLFDDRITASEDKIAALETQNADLLQRIAALEGAGANDGPEPVGVAALVVAIFSLILGSGATFLALKPRSAERKDLKASPDGAVNGAHQI